MKSLAIFLFACMILCLFIDCSDKSSFLKKSRDYNEKERQLEKDIKRVSLRRGIFDLNLTGSYNMTDEIPEDKVYLGNCFMKMHNWFYDLYPISEKGKDFIIKSKEGKLIDFNLCHNVKTACTDKKGLIVDREQCILYAGKKSHDKVWNLTGKMI